MAILNNTLKRFDPNDNLDLCESITNRNWAVKAFGALLESADFEKYFHRHEKKGKYKNGLNQIVKLYVDRQEGELEMIRQKSKDSPERIIIDAWKIFRAVSRGEPASPVGALESIQGVIVELNQVILKFEDEYASQAREVRDKLMPCQEAALKELLEEANELHGQKSSTY